jgi:ABC-2 type transport system permease protein
VEFINSVQNRRGRIETVSCTPVSLDIIFEHLTCSSGAGDAPEDRLPTLPNVIAPQSVDSVPSEMSQSDAVVGPTLNIRSFWSWIEYEARIASAMVKRDVLSETSYRLAFAMQIIEIFLTVTAIYFLSQMIGQDSINTLLAPYGGNYFAFAIIGIAFYSYFNVGFGKFADALREAQTTGTLESMLSTPAGLSTILLSSSLWAFIFTTFRVMLILTSGALLLNSQINIGSLPLVLLILLLTVVSASSFGIIAACFIMVTKRGDPISWLFRSASWLLGGVVFPVGVLPPWMQNLAQLLPTTHALRAMRLVLLKGKSIGDITPEIVALGMFSFVLLPISLRALMYAVRRAKKEGTLTHY